MSEREFTVWANDMADLFIGCNECGHEEIVDTSARNAPLEDLVRWAANHEAERHSG